MLESDNSYERNFEENNKQEFKVIVYLCFLRHEDLLSHEKPIKST